MKRKLDFVTNSSSVSYVGWGVYISEEDMKEDVFLKKCFENYKLKSYADKSLTFDQFKIERDDAKEYVSGSGILNCVSNPSDYYFIIGKPESMKGDQTLNEYKNQIIKELNELGIKVDELEFIQESWFDG